MSEPKHSPGPWVWYGPTVGEGLTFTNEAHVGPGEGNDICGPIAAVSGDDKDQAVANARLIAASPELLRYAKLESEYTRLCDRRRPDYNGDELMEWIESNGIGNEPVGAWLGRIRAAAIAKAKG